MKIHADRKVLAEALAWVGQAIHKSPNTPALAGIRLRATGDQLTVSAFDYDIAHEARVAADVASEGECLVSGSFLRTIVAALPGKSIELTADAGALMIGSGRSTYRAQMFDLQDYPKLPDAPAVVGQVDADILAAAVLACSAPVDDAAPSEGIRGLRLEADRDLDVVGLSTALIIHRALSWTGRAFAATVPSRALVAATAGLSGTVEIGVSESAVGLSDGSRTVVLRSLSGQFANWRVLPRAAEADRFGVTVERDDLLEALKRASLLAKEARDAGAVTLVIDPESLEVTASASSVGGSEVIDAQAGGSEDIPFSPTLILQALAAMEAGPVRIGIGKRRNPDMGALTTIRPGDGGDDRVAVLGARKGGRAR